MKKKLEEMTHAHAEVVKNTRNATDRERQTYNKKQCKYNEGVDKLIDFYEIMESIKKFNAILNEVGGSL